MDARPTDGPRASPGVWAAVAVVILALGALAHLQYLMPGGFDNPAGVDRDGIRRFAEGIGIGAVSGLGVGAFSWSFRALLLAAWAGYGVAIALARWGTAPSSRRMLPVIVGTALGLAVFFPPSLSRDAFAYVAFGRVGAWYGQNPYLHSLYSLVSQSGDDAAAVFPIDASSTYGPVWLVLSCALELVLRSASLFVEVLLMKLLAAAAGVLAAIAGKRIAEVYAPEQADLVLLAIGLNPLLLIEGAGNGHNDLTMVALMLGAVALHAKGRPRAAFLVLGLSAGIKFVSLALAPWLLLEQIRGMRLRASIERSALAAVLLMSPILLAFLPFWSGGATFQGMRKVVAIQTGHAAAGAVPASSLVFRLLPALALYLVLTVVIARSRRPGSFTAPWTTFALALPFLALPSWFAWYLSWGCLLPLTRWDRLHVALSAIGAALALLVMSMYAIPVSP